jgi:hypothetical protein
MAACGQLGGASMGLANNRPAPILTPPPRLRDTLPGAAVAAVAAAAALGGLRGQGAGRARELLLKRKQRQSAGPGLAPR